MISDTLFGHAHREVPRILKHVNLGCFPKARLKGIIWRLFLLNLNQFNFFGQFYILRTRPEGIEALLREHQLHLNKDKIILWHEKIKRFFSNSKAVEQTPRLKPGFPGPKSAAMAVTPKSNDCTLDTRRLLARTVHAVTLTSVVQRLFFLKGCNVFVVLALPDQITTNPPAKHFWAWCKSRSYC